MNLPQGTVDDYRRWLGYNRSAIRYRNPETGQRHHCHWPPFRAPFIARIFAYRSAIRNAP